MTKNTESKKSKRVQTIGEEIANATSHGVMAIFGIVAMVLMLLKAESGYAILGAVVFGLAIFLLYTMSALYHSLAFTKSKGVFKRFDHISIYLLIGGTFAPWLLLLPPLRASHLFGIQGIDAGLLLFIIQWTIITIGIIFKSIWIYRFKFVHLAMYLILGWSGVLFIIDLYSYSAPGFWLTLAGGIAYTLGVVFYVLSSKVKFFHFVWHLMVASGTILQFVAIYLYLL